MASASFEAQVRAEEPTAGAAGAAGVRKLADLACGRAAQQRVDVDLPPVVAGAPIAGLLR